MGCALSNRMKATTADTLERSSLLRAVVIGSSALGAGMLFASLTGLESGTNGFGYRMNLWAIPAFIAGALVTTGYWRMVFRLGAEADAKASRRRLYIASTLLIVLAICSLLYPLRFVSPERRHEIFIGLGVAAFALSTVGFMFRTAVKMLEEEDAANPPPDESH